MVSGPAQDGPDVVTSWVGGDPPQEVLDEPELLGSQECLRPVRRPELRADVGGVPLGRRERDHELTGDRGIARAPRHEAQDLELACGQGLEKLSVSVLPQ